MASTDVLASLSVRIGAQTADFDKALRSSQKTLEQVGNKMQDIGKKLSVSLTVPLAALGGVSLKAAGDMQALQQGLAATMNDAKGAEKELSKLEQTAKMPGLGLQEVVKGSINLQTVGFSADQARKQIELYGNAVAASGKGREEFERAVYGLQQLANTDFPLGEDLNILKDAIPQVTPLLKEAFGTARAEDFRKLGITSKQVIEALEQGLGRLPKVTGGINNAIENARDTAVSSLAKIGTAFNKNFNIEGAINKVSDLVSGLAARFSELSPPVQKAIFLAGGLAASIGPVVLGLGFLTSNVLPALTTGFKTLSLVFSPIALKFGAIAIAAGVLAGVAYSIYQAWEPISNFFSRIFAQVKLSVANGLLAVVEGVESVSSRIGITFDGAKESLKGFAADAQNTLSTTPYTTFGDAIGAVGDSITNNLSTAGEKIKSFFNYTKQEAEATKTAVTGSGTAFNFLASRLELINPLISAANAKFASLKAEATALSMTFNETLTPTLQNIANGISSVSLKGQTFDLLPDAQVEKVNAAAQSIDAAIHGAAVNVAASFGEMLGAAIVTGEGFNNLPKMILGTLFDLAGTVGKIVIGMGFAIESVKNALTSLGGVGAIAAGVALMAIAGAGKAALSRAGSGAGGGSTASPRISEPLAKTTSSKSVDVNVKGEISNKVIKLSYDSAAQNNHRTS